MTKPLSATAGIEQLIAFGRGRHSLKESAWYSGDLLTFLATGEDTRGRFALLEFVARKGNVPPPHIHRREEETCYILEGEVNFSVGVQTIKGPPGTSVFLPRDLMHSFEIESEKARMLVLLTPAGLEGFFKECSVPAPSMTLPPPAEVPYGEIQQMIAVGAKYGLEYVLPKPHAVRPTHSSQK